MKLNVTLCVLLLAFLAGCGDDTPVWDATNPRFTVAGDTVTDNQTGLMWSRNANHGQLTWSDAMAYCDNLTYGGYSDWRLPSREELLSLIDREYRDPAIDNTDGSAQWTEGNPFTGVQSDYYWTSKTFSDDYPNDAWYVYVASGCHYFGTKDICHFYVWPVRGGK